jgi:hypothetical protein
VADPGAVVKPGATDTAAIPGGDMIAQVSIDEDGAVTALVDSDPSSDDDDARLAGLALDDMLARAAATAIDTWFRIRADEEADDGCPGE